MVGVLLATARVVIRWATRDTVSVVAARSWDVLLLLIAIGVAYFIRGATRHEVLGSLIDTVWFLVALVFYFVAVLGVKAIGAMKRLRTMWKSYVLGAPARPALNFEPTGTFPIVAAIRCELVHEDGSPYAWEWHGLAASNHGPGPIAHFPATFIPAPEGDGQSGTYDVVWYWKEKASDWWIPACSDRFKYDVDKYRALATGAPAT